MPLPPPQPGRRIAVVGCCGSGKSHVARALAERLGIPYICNDSLIWGPDWTPVPRAERPARFDAATRGPAWTFDGNISRLADPENRLVMSRLDTLVWLDLPKWTVLGYLLARTLRRVWTGERLWHGNVERWQAQISSDSILLWGYQTHGRYQAGYQRLFADPAWGHVRKVRLCSRAAVNRWLARVRPVSTR